MRKSKLLKFLAVCLSALTLGSLAACGGSTETTSTQNPTSSSVVEETKINKTVIFDFETKKEMLGVIYRDYHGKIEITDDAKYVTSGENCAKFIFKRQVADFRVAFLPGTKFLRKLDFTDTVAFELDVYNDSEETFEVCFAYGIEHFTTLKPGANHLVIPVKRTAVDMTGPQDLSFYLRGLNTPSSEEQWRVIYMDKLVAVTDGQEVLPTPVNYSGDIAYKCNYEHEVYGIFNWMGHSESLFTRPRYSLNHDSKYILTGTGSLKVDFFTNKDGTDISTVGFRTIKGSGQIDWNKYDYRNTYITFDAYNATNKDIKISLLVFTATNNCIGTNTIIKANSWSNPLESRILLQDILDLGVTANLDIMTIVIGVYDMPLEGGTMYLDNISFERK